MCATLNLTLRERLQHDAELLTRLRDRPRAGTLADLFGGLSPKWASEAADRLEIAGRVKEDEAGRLHLAAV
ncbi:hypothetical protein [Gemmata sp.]|uniref:hypothetical protein n=1 Tax=Gemmata sp. TaxID=1914242 RepID=UPI003F711200